MKYTSICYCDLESTSIPVSGVFDVETIHCIAVKSNDNPTLIYTSRFLPLPNYGGTLRNALDVINSHDYCVFHNGIGFDIPVINTLLGTVTSSPLDTMLIAKLLYTKDELINLDVTIPDFPKDKYGSFSLDAFGRRMYTYKGSYSDWSRLTSEMCSYCTQDVEITYHLFQSLLTHPNYPSQDIIDRENKVKEILTLQEYHGFYYDIDSARTLMKSLMHEQLTIELRLQKQFRPMFLPDGPPITPAGSRRNKIYLPDYTHHNLSAILYHPHQYQTTKTGKVKLRGKSYYKWFTTPHRLIYSHTEGEYQKIKLTRFDPGSRDKIRKWLKSMFNFTFSTYTEKGNPKIDADELSFLGDTAVDLMRYLKVVKDISEVRGVLDLVKDHSHSVHGRIDSIGAATHRCTHSSPNVAQTSQDKAFRSLYTVPPNHILVGADLANIEVRVLAHYLHPYDNGAYASAVLSKDMHWYHAGLAGFIDPSIEYNEHDPIHKKARNKSKGFFFGYLYGQGSSIRGNTLSANSDIHWHNIDTNEVGVCKYKDDSKDILNLSFTQAEYDQAKERIEKRLVQVDDKYLFPLKKDEYVEYTERLVFETIYGEQVANIFLERMTGIKELIADCSSQSRSTGYVQAIDGRLLFSRSPHSALNLLLQGSAGIIAKQWMINYHTLAHSIPFYQSAFVHDEFQCTCPIDYEEHLKQALVDGASMVTSQFNMNLPIRSDAVSGINWSQTH